MCRSVPQIAVFSSLISTSFGPISGIGTCSIQMPGAASRLTRAFIIAWDMERDPCGVANYRAGRWGRESKAKGETESPLSARRLPGCGPFTRSTALESKHAFFRHATFRCATAGHLPDGRDGDRKDRA